MTMRRKIFWALFSIFIFLIFTVPVLYATERDTGNVWKKRARITMNTKARLAGAEKSLGHNTADADATQSLGYDALGDPPGQPGITIGQTYYDLQSNSRINRQIETTNDEWIHMIWMKSRNTVEDNLLRGTTYEIWDAGDGSLAFAGLLGGIDIHPFSGPGLNYSGYVSLDVHHKYGMASKAIIANHHDEGADLASTIWFDSHLGYGQFTTYKWRVPDSLMKTCVPPEDTLSGEYRFIWPQHEYHTHDGDTCVHVFGQQAEDGDPESSIIAYFRYHGSDTAGWSLGDAIWDIAMVIDTTPVISQCVSASNISGKVALVWEAPPGQVPGDPESLARDWLDPGLGVNQRTNDVYYVISENMGTTWGLKVNVNAYDSTQGGWLGHGELSTLIDSYDVLHIVSSMRQIVPADAGLGEYVNFYGSRLRHWDEFNNVWSTVKDANWGIEDAWADTFCTGGAWNEMSIVKPTISECDGKYYCIFTQFQDVFNGIYNDCHYVRFSEGDWSGTANGDVYVSVSNNRGLTWDLARNLTDTQTPSCDTVNGAGYDEYGECGHEHYASMPRLGRADDVGIFMGIPVIDPSAGGYAGNYYLPIIYVADRFPGSCMQDRGVWTLNSVKLFRMPCVEPVSSPILSYTPAEINPPAWTKPGVPYVDTGFWENIGNVDLIIDSVIHIPVFTSVTGWLPSYDPGQGTDVVITITSATYGYYIDTIKIYSNSVTGSPQNIPIKVLIADTVQFPGEKDIRTKCKRIAFSNTGNLGSDGGYNGNGGYNLNFFYDGDPRNECDTTDNESGKDNQAMVYLYSGSPFLAYKQGDETILNYSMYDATWLSDDGFRPLYSPHADSTTYPDYQYGYSNVFVNRDTTIALEVELYAPKDDPDTNCFIVMRQKIYGLTENVVESVFVGDIMDWDVPSDDNSNNGSYYDESRKLIYFFGQELKPDTTDNDNCVVSNQRYGGYSYGIGYQLNYLNHDTNVYEIPKAMWTLDNATYVYPENGFVPEQIYDLCKNKHGYSVFESPDPDSEYVDLHMVCCFGQWDIEPGDTLIFYKFMATTYEGLEALQTEIDKAKEWFYPKDEIYPHDCEPGNANGKDPINILDITYLITDLYKNGPPPKPYHICSGDPNCNCTVNILDITYLINYLYKGGPEPCTCEEWIDACGLPLREE